MKICVFSDSHGYAEHMIETVFRESPDLCFFLGDGERDLETLRSRFPTLAVNAVRGNCDSFSTQPQLLNCVVGLVRIFAVHGHRYEVKYDDMLHELCSAALRDNADIVLFGHTHLPLLDHRLGLTILNPGTIGRVREPSYGLMNIENGKAAVEIKYVDVEKKA